jgi:hypothetical protein
MAWRQEQMALIQAALQSRQQQQQQQQQPQCVRWAGVVQLPLVVRLLQPLEQLNSSKLLA